jgi:2,4'-dihydroxyacetophenone dioxygenase
MTLAPAHAPAPVTTSAGIPLPVVALPQGELLTVNVGDIPLMKDALGPGVSFQPLRLDLELGEWVLLATFAPGIQLPIHYHTGAVDAWTMSGSWHYLEYPDQPQTAGSYLYEPGSSVHTLKVPDDNTEDTVVWFRISGANVNFNEDGTFHSVLDAALVAHLTREIAAAQGDGPVRYIGGGAARFTADAT